MKSEVTLVLSLEDAIALRHRVDDHGNYPEDRETCYGCAVIGPIVDYFDAQIAKAQAQADTVESENRRGGWLP